MFCFTWAIHNTGNENQEPKEHRGWLIYCTSTPFLCLLTEAIVSLEHRLRGIEVAPQPEHRLRGEKCERVKKEAPQPRGRCSLQHGARVEEQTCFLVGNNFLAFPVSLLPIILSCYYLPELVMLGVSNLINSWPRKGCFWAENIISLNICTNSDQKHFHGTTLVNEEFDHNLQGQHLGISL